MSATRKKSPPIAVPSDGWMSVTMAARALGAAYTTVYAMALKGDLQHKTFADRVFIHRDSVDRILAEREQKRAAI